MASAARVSLLLLLLGLPLAAPAASSDDGDETSLLQVTRGGVRARRAARRGGRQIPTYPKPTVNLRTVLAPSFVVDLDAPPEQRWQNVTRHYKALGAFPTCCDATPAQLRAFKLVLSVMPVPDEYRRELLGIVADVGHPDVTLESLLIRNVGYELTGSWQTTEEIVNGSGTLFNDWQADFFGPVQGCSGLLAAMENGTVVHGRNMDLEEGHFNSSVTGKPLHWADVTIEVLFIKGGKPFIVSVHWPGMTGFHTAMRFGGWSFEQNTRWHGIMPDVLFGLLRHSEGFAWRSRRVMESTPDFDTALQRLNRSNLMAPSYFILAGAKPYEGAVLTLDRGNERLEGTPPVFRLVNGTMPLAVNLTQPGWRFVQTNDDYLEEPLDDRRMYEEPNLNWAKQWAVNPKWMFKEMTTAYLMTNITIFNTVYVPSTGFYQTKVFADNWKNGAIFKLPMPPP